MVYYLPGQLRSPDRLERSTGPLFQPCTVNSNLAEIVLLFVRAGLVAIEQTLASDWTRCRGRQHFRSRRIRKYYPGRRLLFKRYGWSVQWHGRTLRLRCECLLSGSNNRFCAAAANESQCDCELKFSDSRRYLHRGPYVHKRSHHAAQMFSYPQIGRSVDIQCILVTLNTMT